jgi:hypothetical protein
MVEISKLKWTPQNGRTVVLNGDLTNVHQTEVDGEITRLYTEEGLEVKVGGTVYPLPKSPFRVNKIVPMVVGGKLMGYRLYNSLLTSSSTFALPFLGVNQKWFLWDSLFINCFIGTTPEDTGKVIALLYRFSGKPVFLKFESAMCAFRNFIKRYDPDPYHVMFVFDVPTAAVKSYEHFVNGRYSEIDGIWKLKIMDFHGFDIDGHTGKILFKSETLRKDLESKLDVELSAEAELHSAPDLEFEVFNPDYYLTSDGTVK